MAETPENAPLDAEGSWRSTIEHLQGARRIAFVCVANSARSQMAEGIARSVAPAIVQLWSAGSEPTSVRMQATLALAEIGINIDSAKAKSLADIPLSDVDAVVVLCAEDRCPILPASVKRIGWQLPDPAGASDEQHAFREVRDELRRRFALVWPARN